MLIEDGHVVAYTLRIQDPAGEVVYATDAQAPDTCLHGRSPVIAAVQRALAGRAAGDRIAVRAEPEQAFGPHRPELVRAVPRSEWPAEVPAVPGPFAFAIARPDAAPAEVRGAIVAVDDAYVHIDQNAWMAGVALDLELEVLSVREATPAEQRAGQALVFPWDLLAERPADGLLGERLAKVAGDSMTPPFPWGQVLFAHLLPRLAHLEGDVAELGVGLGGMSMFLALHLPERTVYALDTYEGLPPAAPDQDNPYFTEGLYGGDDLLARLHARLDALGLHNVRPVKGRFADTVDQLPPRLCFAHLDSDLYASVLDSLEATWDRLEDGGILGIDDFFHPSQGAARALATFCNRRGLNPVVHVVFPYSVFLVKGGPQAPRGSRCHDGFAYSFNWLRTEPRLRAAVTASVARAWPGTAPHRDACTLLAVLDAPHDRPEDIYDYWRAMSGFWQQIAAGFFHPDRIG